MTENEAHLAERLRALPAVDLVMRELGPEGPVATSAARSAVERARQRVRSGAATPSLQDIVDDARAELAGFERGLLRRVINATGVLIHTNLGRVPLGPQQLDAVQAVASGYSNLEYDLEAGARGSRHAHARRLLTALTGAESGLVVNNNAAAVLVVLAALCARREVVISRGELIEIGGEFRIPDVLEASGATLVEVGTTNRTHLADYERAITPETAAILKVHPSNYRVVGFTSAVPGRDLARLASGRRLLFVHDLGSGLMSPGFDTPWARSEPTVAEALDDGADVVTFSGDKLLGGPQAGIVLGRAALVDRVAAHPLMRAIRPDKMTLAALEATLRAHLDDKPGDLPLWQMATADDLEGRASAVAAALGALTAAGAKVETVPVAAVTGGGSLPGAELPSWAIAVSHPERSPDALARALRGGDVPVIARIDDDRLLLDLRTVAHGEDRLLASLVERAFEAI